MAILEKINTPEDLQIIKKELLPGLSAEIRNEIIQTVSANGGHLASSLGTVELTVALHYVFKAPKDKILWDVGHQSYAHKLLTGRRAGFSTLRTLGGISGFPRREESPYDPFTVGHSSTSISAAVGFAAARDIKQDDYRVVAVIGDGSMTGGLAFEGLQNAGHLGTDLLVVLNDNEMFISHRVGALASYLAKLLTAGTLKKLEKKVELFFKRMHFWGSHVLRVAKRFKVLLFPGMLFEEMGFSYLGPVDGHDVFGLIEILSKVKQLKGPVLLHIITKKGKGYTPAENEPTKFHGVGRFNIITGETEPAGKVPSYTQVFSQTLVKLAREDERVVAITAAMPEGTGLDAFAREFPGRFFDVGIAEGHAVTFAGGLAAEGLRPVCSIYSTFLQRSLDQLIHDVALQKLPVVIAADRAGIVGEDGATHQGAFDLSFTQFIPNFTVMAPADENELQHMLKTALSLPGPSLIRFPRGSAVGVPFDREPYALPVGKAEVLREGKDLYLCAIGNTVHPALSAAGLLAARGISAGVVNVRFLKPFDEARMISLAAAVKHFVVVEENSLIGGLGSRIYPALNGQNVKILHLALPDSFIEHGDPKILREKYNLTAEKIAARTGEWFARPDTLFSGEESIKAV
ncbi:MAG: 1-deoxy-D-xylulose-5-phosphate synthase [Endomicrobiales bacterium]